MLGACIFGFMTEIFMQGTFLVYCCSFAQLCLTVQPCGLQHTRLPCLSLSLSLTLVTLLSIELIIPSSNLILCHPLLLLSSIYPSIRVFSNELTLHIRWPNYWSFSISPSSEYSGLISYTWTLLYVPRREGSLVYSTFSFTQFITYNEIRLSHYQFCFSCVLNFISQLLVYFQVMPATLAFIKLFCY